MLGFGKKRTNEFGKERTNEVPKELLETKDCLMRILAAAIDVYTATMVGYLTKPNGVTKIDVEQELKRMLAYLDKYVHSEILIERVRNGGKVTPAELAELRWSHGARNGQVDG